jgi:hypothetical protein
MSADFKANVVDDLGNVQPASTVTVRDVNGALIPAGELFSDAALTIPFAANPFTTDAQGSMNFFIEPQTVNITAQKGAFVKTWDDYVLNEQIDTSDFATAAQGTLADSATQPGDLGTAALVDTGTASGNVPLNSDLGNASLDDKTSSGAVLWDDGNYQPEVSLGLGVVRIMKNNSGTFIGSGGTVAGSDLEALFVNTAGALIVSGVVSPTGTWKNVGGGTIGDQFGWYFVRIL